MKKAMIIGCPGAGKSCFARKLRELTGLPLIHLDLIWHLPDKTTRTREEFDRILTAELAKDAWIIDGNYSCTLEMRLEKADTVFLLDLPTEVCLAGAAARIGHQRKDLPWQEETFDPEFEAWIRNFSTQRLPQLYAVLERYRTRVRILVFHSHKEIDSFFERGAYHDL